MYREIERKEENGLSTRWIMTKKLKNGEERWKARLVVQGFEEKKKEGRTEAPMYSSELLKISVIKRERLKVRSIDVKTLYLQGKNIENNSRQTSKRSKNREVMDAEEGSLWPQGCPKGMV